MEKRTSPSSGERNAMTGYVPQYEIFALKILNHLRDNTLNWFMLGNPDAGKADDINICYNKTLECVQVKWSNKSDSTFRFSNLKELIPGLLDGWKSLSKNIQYKNLEFKFRIITNRPLQIKNQLKDNTGRTIGAFNEFITDGLDQFKENTTDINRFGKWKDIWLSLINEGTDKENFTNFVKSLEVFPNYSIQSILSTDSILNYHLLQLRDKIVRFLLREISKPDYRIKITKEELISDLKLQNLFQTTYVHDFDIDKAKYAEIKSTETKLNQIISNMSKGYVFLLGSPGSGKSSLLKIWSDKLQCKKFIYFAYSNLGYNERGRGDTKTFFHDILILLQENYPSDPLSNLTENIGSLKRECLKQLNKASENYQARKEKTIIIVDGLDHVPREYKPAESFLRDLFHPDQLPEGVIIILGSQNKELSDIDPAIISHTKTENRIIKISQLDFKDVSQIARNTLNKQLTDNTLQTISKLSAGHPLYLKYLLQKLLKTQNIDRTLHELSNNKYSGNILDYYNRLWNYDFKNNPELQELLGIIARLRKPIKLKYISTFEFSPKTFITFRQKCLHLFKETLDESLIFFHNSFKQFVLLETSKDPITELPNNNKEKQFHKKILRWLEKLPEEENWDMLFHSWKAENQKKFKTFITLELFRNQFFSLRPENDIRDDLMKSVDFAIEKHDVILILRSLFILTEVNTRAYHFNDFDLAQLFSSTNRINNLLTLIQYHNISYPERFRIVNSIYKSNSSIAEKIFLETPPPDFFIEIDNRGYRGELDRKLKELEDYITAASYFTKPTELIDKIISLRINEKENSTSNTDNEEKFLLLNSLALKYLDEKNYYSYEIVFKEIEKIPDAENKYQLYTLAKSIRRLNANGDIEIARTKFKLFRQIFEGFDELDQSEQIIIADMHFHLFGDISLAEKYLRNYTIWDLDENIYVNSPNFNSAFKLRFSFNTLVQTFNPKLEPEHLLPQPKKNTEKTLYKLEINITRIAQIYAFKWRGLAFSPEQLLHHALPLISFMSDKNLNSIDHRDFFFIHKYRIDYYKLLISSFSEFGKDYIIVLFNYFFTKERFAYKLALNEWREILLFFYEQGIELSSIRKCLAKFWEFSLAEMDINGKMREYYEQAMAFSKIQDKKNAEKCINLFYKISFGIVYKADFQLTSFIDWYYRLLETNPKKFYTDISWILERLSYVRNITEGSASLYAFEKILEIISQLDPNKSFALAHWGAQNNLIGIFPSLLILLSKLKINSKEEYLIAKNIFFQIITFNSKSSNGKALGSLLQYSKIFEKEYTLEQIIIDYDNLLSIYATSNNYYYYLKILMDFSDENNTKVESLEQKRRLLPKNNQYYDEVNPKVTTAQGQSKELVQILEEYQTKESFLKFTSLITKVDYNFHWEILFSRLTFNFSIDEANSIYKNLERHIQPDGLIKFAQFLINKGHKELAIEVTYSALSLAKSYSWFERYDGGSKFKAFSFFKDINYSEKDTLLLKHLNDDIHDRKDYIKEMLEKFLDIIELTELEYDLEKCINELNQYLSVLLEESKNNKVEFDWEHKYDDWWVELINYCINSESPSISTQAQRLILKVITIKPNEMQLIISSLLIGSEIQIEKALKILSSLSIHNSLFSKLFIKELGELLNHQNHFIRKLSQDILNNGSFQPQTYKKLQNKIPAIYNITLPKTPNIYHEPITSEYHELVSDNTEVSALTKIYEPLLTLISKNTSIPFENLVVRIGELINLLPDKERITRNFEKQFRKQHSDLGIETKYIRPRYQVVNHAFYYLFTELIDHGFLKEETLDSLYSYFDTIELLIEPEIKPKFIQMDFSRIDETNFIKNIRDSIEFLKFEIDDWYIVGEKTIIKNLRWEQPSEIRQSTFHFNKSTRRNDEIFPKGVSQIKHTSCIDLSKNNDSFSLKKDDNYTPEPLFKDFIYFNPNIAYELNLSPIKHNILKWEKENGLIVNWIFWQSGNIDISPFESESFTTQGITILCKKDYLAHYCKTNNIELNQTFCLKRTKRKNNKDLSNTYFDSRIILPNNS